MLPQIYYKNSDSCAPLPGWCKFFISLGYELSKSKKAGCRHVVGISVPARAYCAPFLAVGVILHRATIPKNDVSDDDYFESLCGLPPGSPVKYLKEGRKFSGIFDGVYIRDGKRLLRVKVETRKTKKTGQTPCSTWEYFSAGQSKNIEVAARHRVSLSPKQKGVRVFEHKEFFNSFIKEVDQGEFVRNARIESIILGQAGILRHEISDTVLAVKSEGNSFVEGTLQELLRVKKFLMDKSQPYRTQVITSRGNPSKTDSLLPCVAIFDGAASFLNKRDEWRGLDWVIILDRSESYFKEAANTLNQEYQYRSHEEPLNIPTVPKGIEIMFFQEAI